MEYKHISEIPFAEEMAIIVNVGTKYLSTLALLSIKKHTDLTVLLIDCPSSKDDGSYCYFLNLFNHVDYHLLQLPLKSHGFTLDYIFKNINSERILLIDSDAEIISSELIKFFLKEARKDNHFGAGYKHEHKSTESDNYGLMNGLYCERMWMPCTVLNVRHVREALEANISFHEKYIYTNSSNKIIQKIARKWYKRKKHSFFKKYKFPFADLFSFNFLYINVDYVKFDTGALIFQYLSYEKHYDYMGISVNNHYDYIIHDSLIHRGGVTRAILHNDSDIDINQFETAKELIDRIKKEYLIDVSNF